MVMLRPSSDRPNTSPAGFGAASRDRGATGVRALIRFTIRTFALPIDEHHRGHGRPADEHPRHGGPGAESHLNKGIQGQATEDRWAFLRQDPPRHPDQPDAAGGHGNRLNLLLSWGGWQNESWVDRLPALLEPMGVHSLRVRTAREAERAIRMHPVHIAVVDLGLPLDASSTTPAPATEEAGPRVLELLRRLESPPPTVVVQQSRSARDATRHMAAALRCDAFAVVDRAAADVELMLKVLQRCMQRFYHGRWPGI